MVAPGEYEKKALEIKPPSTRLMQSSSRVGSIGGEAMEYCFRTIVLFRGIWTDINWPARNSSFWPGGSLRKKLFTVGVWVTIRSRVVLKIILSLMVIFTRLRAALLSFHHSNAFPSSKPTFRRLFRTRPTMAILLPKGN